MVMTFDELIARARQQAGTGTKYRLGGGKTTGVDPRDENASCDCSAYVCWCLDIRKHQPSLAWLQPVNGGWYNTDGIWWDATNEQTGHFAAIEKPAPGAIIVFPSRGLSKVPGPKIGHVGIVTKVASNGTITTLHCSSGNFNRTGDTIRDGLRLGGKRRAPIDTCAAAQRAVMLMPNEWVRQSRTGLPSKAGGLWDLSLKTYVRLACAGSSSGPPQIYKCLEDRNLELEAPPGFEPGMEVLQISLGCRSCWLALFSGPG